MTRRLPTGETPFGLGSLNAGLTFSVGVWQFIVSCDSVSVTASMIKKDNRVRIKGEL